MPKETVFCEMCFTNASHAHVRDMPVCAQCIEEFKFATGLVYLDAQPYEALDGQRMSDAVAMDHEGVSFFSPRNSAELIAADLVAAS